MAANPEEKSLVKRMRESAAGCSGFASTQAFAAINRKRFSDAAIDLNQGANAIEDLAKAALAAFEVAARKGMLFVTDPDTGSDKLVGYFVPATEMLKLYDTAKPYKEAK